MLWNSPHLPGRTDAFLPLVAGFWTNSIQHWRAQLTWHWDIHHKQLLESSGNARGPAVWSSSPAGNCISVCQVPVLPLACSWQPAAKRKKLTPAHRPAPQLLITQSECNLFFCACDLERKNKTNHTLHCFHLTPLANHTRNAQLPENPFCHLLYPCTSL